MDAPLWKTLKEEADHRSTAVYLIDVGHEHPPAAEELAKFFE